MCLNLRIFGYLEKDIHLEDTVSCVFIVRVRKWGAVSTWES